MKRKIIIGLVLFCLIFLVGGYAVVRTIEQFQRGPEQPGAAASGRACP